MGSTPMPWSRTGRLMRRALDERMFTGAVLLVEHRGVILEHEPYGAASGEVAEAVTRETFFDLASLTKILVTTPCWMKLCEGLPGILEEPLSAWFSDVPESKAPITPRAILSHTSGLRPWRPYYLYAWPDEIRSERTLRAILSEPLLSRPETSWAYSDLGFMLLAFIIERETGRPFADYAHRELFEPLGLGDQLTFHPCPQSCRIAATRFDEPPGRVNDLNARALGGAAGHAGLFGTAAGAAAVMRAVVRSARKPGGFFDCDVARMFLTRATDIPGCTRALGFDTPSAEGSSSGRYFSERSVGHTGFTGTSIWADLDTDTTVVLLTNRVIMGETDLRIKEFRPVIHDAIVEDLRNRADT